MRIDFNSMFSHEEQVFPAKNNKVNKITWDGSLLHLVK